MDYVAQLVSSLREPWLEFIAYTALLLALLSGATTAYVLWKRRHTRERYAFVALSATVGLTLTAVSVLAMPNWLELMVSLLPIEAPRELNLAERILIVLVIGYAMRQINLNHREWDGPKSAAHHQRDRLHEDLGLVKEGLGEVKRMLEREPPPEPVDKAAVQKATHQLQLPDEENLVWHKHVHDLLRLGKPSYQFDIEKGWHDLEHCWIGQNTRTKEAVAVFCTVDPPTAVDLEQFVSYVESRTANSANRDLFVALPGDATSNIDELERLGGTLLTEDDLLEELVDFSSYRRHIIDRFTKDHLPDSTLTFNDVYVSPNATPGISIGDENAKVVTLDDLLAEWANEESQRHLAILGDYGQGKSTCALAFTYRLLTADNPGGRMPLLIELRGRSPSTPADPLEFLGAWGARFDFSSQALLKLIAAGKVILIFEGFDEMANVSDYESRVQHLQALWQFCFPSAKLLFTGRRNFFLDDQETLQSLGIHDAGGGPYCEPFHLRPFSTSQIRATLGQSAFQATDELLQLADQSESFKEVVSRPSTLYMISVLWAAEADTLRAGVSSAKVLQLFINRTYKRQAEKQRQQRPADRRFMHLTIAERAYFMLGIAAHMAAQRLKNQITQEDLEAVTERLYEVIPDRELATKALPALGEPTKPLKTRIGDRPDALDALKTDVRTYGLLVRDPSSQNAYRFPHKSYLELLFAEFTCEIVEGAQKWPASNIRVATGAQLADLADSPESAMFLPGILSVRSSKSTEDELFKALVLTPHYPLSRLLPWRMLKFLCQGFWGGYRAKEAHEVFEIEEKYNKDVRFMFIALFACLFSLCAYFFALVNGGDISDEIGTVVAISMVSVLLSVWLIPRELARSRGYNLWVLLRAKWRFFHQRN